MRLRLNKIKFANFWIAACILVLAAVVCSGGLFRSHKEKAEEYLRRSLEEFEKGIIQHPDDGSLQSSYYQLLACRYGETAAKCELVLLFEKTDQFSRAEKILKELSANRATEAAGYFKKKLESARDASDQIAIYRSLMVVAPEEAGLSCYRLGRLYLGTGDTDRGIEFLEKARSLHFEDPELPLYLARAYAGKKDWRAASEVAEWGLTKREDLKLRRFLAETYLKMGDRERYAAQKEKLRMLAAKKEVPSPAKPIVSAPGTAISKQAGTIAPYIYLVAEKQTQQLSVCRYDGSSMGNLLSVPCSTGKNHTNKQKQGDYATPEGTFLITAFIPSSKLDPKYGEGAFVLDFPDYIARRENRSGRGIWIHGTPIERPPYNSEGCIVVSDKDFLAIKPYVAPGKTFIHILASKESDLPQDYQNILKFLENWRTAWESRDTEKYLSFYDRQFSTDGKNFEAWAEYKRNVNRQKKYIKVDLSDIKIFPYGATSFGDVYLVSATQKYSSSNMSSKVAKTFYIKKKDNSFSILGELTR